MRLRVATAAAVLAAIPDAHSRPQGQSPPHLIAPSGLRLLVDEVTTAPTLRLLLPGRPPSDRSIVILCPEHVTAVVRGESEGRHLYRWEPGRQGAAPAWRRVGRSLEYQRDLPDSIRFTARATLESDGVRVRYEFRNRSKVSYDMIVAVTDPRLTGVFHDARLERTWVHYPSGLELLAAETPARLAMPRDQWLPARYLASSFWPRASASFVLDGR